MKVVSKASEMADPLADSRDDCSAAWTAVVSVEPMDNWTVLIKVASWAVLRAVPWVS